MLHFLITILEQIQNEETRILKARIALKNYKYTNWALVEYQYEGLQLERWSKHFHALLMVMLLHTKENDRFLLLEEKLRKEGLKDWEKWQFYWYSRKYKRLCRDHQRTWKVHRQTQHK